LILNFSGNFLPNRFRHFLLVRGRSDLAYNLRVIIFRLSLGGHRPRVNQFHFNLWILFPNLIRHLLRVQIWQVPIQQHAIARPLQQLRQRVRSTYRLFAHHIRVRRTPFHAIPKQRISARHQNPAPRSHHAWCRRGRH
jgi:hypothetical protein